MGSSTDTICCPRFEPEKWDNLQFEWHKKSFIKAPIRTLLYMPLNFGKVMTNLDKMLTAAEASNPDHLCLSDHSSKSHMDVYLATDKEIPGANNIALSGHYFSAAYEGNFKDTEKWMLDFESRANGRSLTIKKTFLWYTTCPKCAKKYGENYVVVIGEIVPSQTELS